MAQVQEVVHFHKGHRGDLEEDLDRGLEALEAQLKGKLEDMRDLGDKISDENS